MWEITATLRYKTSLQQAVEYVLKLPGKRMRPLLCLLSSALEGGSPWRAVPAAAAVEILHTFTLVHDDIMDRSPLRRGQPTVHVRWGDAIAILTGDVLVGLAYRFIERYADHPRYYWILHTMTAGLLEVSEGQALDLELPQVERPTLEHYWQMVDGKTTALFRCTLLIGACVGELTPQTQHLVEELAIPLGRAFQLQDDLLDLIGRSDETGKQQGQDLYEGKLTYAVIRALELLPGHQLLEQYRQARGVPTSALPQLVRLFRELGLLQEMEQWIEHYYASAFAVIEQLPAAPARELLRGLVEQLRYRRR